MPSAEFPPNQPQSESTEANNPSPQSGTNHPPEQEWQTVDFPNTMSVDQLPVVDSADQELSPSPTPQPTANFLEIAPQLQPETEQDLKPENSTEFIQALQECNQDLIDRIAELEAELEAGQQTLREKEALLNQQTQELALATEQVTRLFGKQELSNQVIQRQQVLVETLTQQWETSQTKMAQMERDCALTQQRYNEQFHELMQTQNTCRDLRSRLHRQQRHTLQFKAALERALEMQSRWVGSSQPRQPHLNKSELMIDLPTSTASEATQSEPVETEQTSRVSVPKAPPVQPWSMPPTADEKSVEVLEEIIQEQEKNPFYAQPAEIPAQTSEPTPDSVATPESSPQLNELESYWHVELPTNLTEPQDSDLQESSEAQFMEDELERIRTEYASLNPEAEEDNDIELELLESVPKALTEEQSQSVEIHPSQPQSQSIPPQPTTSNWPAPLLRPQNQRKLQSIAAIELPKLPKPSHWTPESESPSVQEFAEIEPF